MPRQPIDIRVPVFTGGLNEVLDPTSLRSNEARVANNVDYASGALLGLKASGASSYTDSVPSSPGSMWFKDGYWLVFSGSRYALDDGQSLYLTQPSSYPVVWHPTGYDRLGLAETPAITGTANVAQVSGDTGKIAKWFRYAITFVTDDGLESNPSFVNAFGGSLSGGDVASLTKVKISFTPPTDSRITKVKVYRSLATNYVNPSTGLTTGIATGIDSDYLTTDASYGALYYLGSHSPASDGFITDSGAPNGTIQLTHGAGGFTGSEGTTDDHSPAPNLVMLSNGIHSTTQTNGGSGILVGLDDTGTVRYSRFGQPHYWPVNNSFKPPGNVQAIITHTAMTLIVTDLAIYAMTGNTDDNVSFALTNANVGCLPGAGRSVIYTPYGVLFPSIRGLELFDGSNSQVITSSKLAPSTLQAMKIRSAAFWDNRYHLFHDDGTLIVDLRSLPDVVLTKSDVKVSAAHVANAVGGSTITPSSMTIVVPGSSTAGDPCIATVKDALGNRMPFFGKATVDVDTSAITGVTSVTIDGQARPATVSFDNGVASFHVSISASYTGYYYVTITLQDYPAITANGSGFYNG